MGSKNKLIRFKENDTFENVFQPTRQEVTDNKFALKGKWNTDFFKNNNPITLELACGKGEYALGLGTLYPQRNFIGIDIKGNRIWRGAKTALAQGLSNVAFLRIEIDQLADYFKSNEVSEIWITFPDPQLRVSKAKKRLTHPKFLRIYKSVILPTGLIHLKTDSPDLYHFTKTVINLYGLKLLADKEDIRTDEFLSDDLKIKTHYESLDIAKSNRIHYLQFQLNDNIPAEKDAQLKILLNGENAD